MIHKRIYNDYQYVESLGYKVLGVFLQGSQNYGLEYEGSDIDTKCIVLPSFEDFCLNKKPVSTTLILPSNEHIDLKDIRLMFDCFKKQNVNFVEILFTEYNLINEKYKALYQPMLDNAEMISKYNNYAFVNCMAGMSMEKYKALEHPYHNNNIDKIEKISKGDWIDLRAAESVELKSGEFKIISLGVSMKLPDGYEAHIVPRSSTFKKWGILQTNHMGVIDNSYSGDNDVWGMPVIAMRDTVITENDRICQFRIVEKMPNVQFNEVDKLNGQDRGGFGSTGTN